jgi:hypothetical protein
MPVAGAGLPALGAAVPLDDIGDDALDGAVSSAPHATDTEARNIIQLDARYFLIWPA